MSEPKPAVGRIVEGIVAALGASTLTAVGAFIWPSARTWLTGEIRIPGWSVAAVIIVAITAVFVATRAIASNHSPIQPAPLAGLDQGVFGPTALQMKCVAALRFFDDQWVPFDDMAGVIADDPRADVRQALEELVRQGWAKDGLNTITGPSYQLAGAGLDFARQHKFPVGQKPVRG